MAEVKTGYHGEITSAGGGAKEWMRAFFRVILHDYVFFCILLVWTCNIVGSEA